MTPILPDDPCILFALRRERAPFCRAYRPRRRFPDAPCWARFCRQDSRHCLVVETGVGQANVGRTLDWLLASPIIDGAAYRPRFILFAGFAGALTDGRHVGDVLRADEICDLHGHAWPTTWLDGARTRPCGRLLTTDHLVATPDEKRQLGAQYHAVAVEMESALFAARCTAAGIPFGCIRVISDAVTTALSPALLSFLADGRVSFWRLLTTLLRHPGLLSELLRLARDTKQASEQLGWALEELLK